MPQRNQSIDSLFGLMAINFYYLIEADRDLQQLLVAERSMMIADPNSESFKLIWQGARRNIGRSLPSVSRSRCAKGICSP